MSVLNSKPIELKGWPGGVNNVAAETKLKRTELREAENVDIDKDGTTRRRGGADQVRAATRTHSLFCAPGMDFMLGVENGVLKSYDAALMPTTLRSGLNAGLPLSYVVVDENVYYVNEQTTGKVTFDGVHSTLGVESPSGQPLLAESTTAGGLHAGTYQVAVTFVTASGEESGSTLASYIDVDTGSGIQLTAVPQPLGSGV